MKVVVITGCANGIGVDLANSYVKAGYKVVGLDVVYPKENIHYDFIQCDLRKPAEIKNAFSKIKAKYETAHVFINNVAILSLKNLYNNL